MKMFRPPECFSVMWFAAAMLAGAAAAWLIRFCGMCQITGFDHSQLIDIGWRLYNGQVVYKDFPCFYPPGFFLGAKAAFCWFGPRWSSLVDVMALFAFVTLLWTYALLARLTGQRGLALFLAATLQAMTSILCSFWWYNPITAIATVIYGLSALCWVRDPTSPKALLSYGAALLVLAAMKPNMAGLMIVSISIILFFSSVGRLKVVAVSLATLGVFICGLWMNGVSFRLMLDSYVGASPRGLPTGEFVSALVKDWTAAETLTVVAALLLLLLPPVVLLIAGCRKKLRGFSVAGVCIGLFMVASGLYGFLTNGEQKIIDISPVLFGGFVLVLECQCLGAWQEYFACLCSLLMCVGLIKGLDRDRIRAGGVSTFYDQVVTGMVHGGFFNQLKTGPSFMNVCRDIDKVLMRAGPGASVWFGPRLQWGYAFFNRPSPKDEPLVWYPGTGFAYGEDDKWFNKIVEHRHTVLIFMKNDFVCFRKDLIESLGRRYVVQTNQTLTVMYLKSGL